MSLKTETWGAMMDFGQAICHSARAWFARNTFCLPKLIFLVVQVLVQAQTITCTLLYVMLIYLVKAEESSKLCL